MQFFKKINENSTNSQKRFLNFNEDNIKEKLDEQMNLLRGYRGGNLRNQVALRKNRIKSAVQRVKILIKTAFTKNLKDLFEKSVKDWYEYINSEAALMNRNFIEETYKETEDSEETVVWVEIMNGNQKLTNPNFNFLKVKTEEKKQVLEC